MVATTAAGSNCGGAWAAVGLLGAWVGDTSVGEKGLVDGMALVSIHAAARSPLKMAAWAGRMVETGGRRARSG